LLSGRWSIENRKGSFGPKSKGRESVQSQKQEGGKEERSRSHHDLGNRGQKRKGEFGTISSKKEKEWRIT